jgi:hypothetical protein
MGGSGSGRHWSTVRSTTAECPSLDVRRLQRAGFLMPGRSFPCTWTGADKKASSIQVTVYEDRIELAYDCGSANTGQPGERYCYSVLLEWVGTAELSSEHKPFALVSAEPETCSSRSPRSPKACTV